MNGNNQTYKTLSIQYVEACGLRKTDVVASFLSPSIEVTGNVIQSQGAAAFLDSVAKVWATLIRNKIKRVFTEGDEVCVFYDLVTETGSMGAVERLSWVGNRLDRVEWFLDQ